MDFCEFVFSSALNRPTTHKEICCARCVRVRVLCYSLSASRLIYKVQNRLYTANKRRAANASPFQIEASSPPVTQINLIARKQNERKK